MNDQRQRLTCDHYPAPANHIADDPTPKSEAVYIPSVSPGYAMDVYAQNWRRPLPNGVGSGDLNFLDPGNKLFRISHVMSSAGQALMQPRPCIVTERDRSATMLICDSGGYQIASGRLRINGDADRLRILRWMEQHADVAMTLDVPTGPIGDPGYAYSSSADCLMATLEHLDFFQRNRVPGKIKLLNVLQGNTLPDSDIWYDAVKQYDFEGWAFAGHLRHNMYAFCRRILQMADENRIQNKHWIHVLGTSELDTAVLLTALQRAINRHLNPNLRISFDTSTPFRRAAFGTIETLPEFKLKVMTMPARNLPDGHKFVGSDVRWPWPSPLGDRMVMGDVCVAKPTGATSYHDVQSRHYIAHHNLGAQCWGIAMANRVFDSECIDHKHSIAIPVGEAVELIERVFASGAMAELERCKNVLAALRHGKLLESGEDERKF